MHITLKSKSGTHYAEAEYDNGKVTIMPGSKINLTLAFEKMPPSIRKLRENPVCVSRDGTVLKEVTFQSPTSAAQFVTGRSVNGKIAWRVEDKVSLKAFLEY